MESEIEKERVLFEVKTQAEARIVTFQGNWLEQMQPFY